MKNKFFSTIMIALFGMMMTVAYLPNVSAQNNFDINDLKTWANYERYAEANQSVSNPVAVFMGNSITDNWARMHEAFFTENNFVGRGISGQVTAQMLARFRADVLNLHPKVVVIMAGTNDVARNQKYMPVEHVAGNIISMVELAIAHGIKPIILSILPANKYGWRPEITDSTQQILQINALLESYAKLNGISYIDLFNLMKDENQGLPKKYSQDGVHPNLDGYALIEPIVKAEILRLAK
jgi:lysophospholipase L1-like esterase